MALTKTLICALVATFLTVVAVSSTPYQGQFENYATTNKSHNLILGSRQPGDRLVYTESIVKASKWLQVVTAEKTFNVDNFYTITQVRAMDQKTNGNGATASVLSGGAGYSTVGLRFKSQRGHGINFVVEIYAKPRY